MLQMWLPFRVHTSVSQFWVHWHPSNSHALSTGRCILFCFVFHDKVKHITPTATLCQVWISRPPKCWDVQWAKLMHVILHLNRLVALSPPGSSTALLLRYCKTRWPLTRHERLTRQGESTLSRDLNGRCWRVSPGHKPAGQIQLGFLQTTEYWTPFFYQYISFILVLGVQKIAISAPIWIGLLNMTGCPVPGCTDGTCIQIIAPSISEGEVCERSSLVCVRFSPVSVRLNVQ